MHFAELFLPLFARKYIVVDYLIIDFLVHLHAFYFIINTFISYTSLKLAYSIVNKKKACIQLLLLPVT